MVSCISFFKRRLDFRTLRCIACLVFSLQLNVAISDISVPAGQSQTGTTDSFRGSGEIKLIAKNSTLIINQDTNGTLNNKVSGAGSLAKYGSGNVTLTAQNTYTWQTEINGGSLTGTTQSFGSGNKGIFFNRHEFQGSGTDQDKSDDTALIINQDFDGGWNHKLLDSSSSTATSRVFKRGSGTVTITTQSYIIPEQAHIMAPWAFNTRIYLSGFLPDEWHVEEGTLRAGGKYTLGFTGFGNGSDYFVGRSGTVDLNGFDQAFAELHNAGTVKLDVTSRKVVWLFLEQLRFEIVPFFHRLQRRLTVQS